MESFEEVYQKYLKEVYCFLLRLSGDREIAEELTQQTFAIAFEKLENWKISEVNVNYRCGYVRLQNMNIMHGQKSRKDMQIN